MTESNDVTNGLETNIAQTNGSASNIDVLKDLCTNNANYFAEDNSENGQRLYISFMGIKENLDALADKMFRVEAQAGVFDFDENTPGNGYRSFVSVANLAIDFAIQLNKKVCLKRGGAFFRKNQITKDVESCAHLLASLDTCFKHLETLLSWSTPGNLFPKEEHSPQELLANYEDINQYCFYGRCLGFQFCESIKNLLQFVSMSMAIFSEIYYNQGSFLSKATSSLVATSKYVNDPEQRARRIVNISQNADINFCKAFWFLSENELMTNMPYVVTPSVAVSKIINIPPEPLTLEVDGKEIEVPVPSSHIGRKPIQVRLISYEVHDGMIGEASNKSKSQPPSRGLLIHCHGGGFVAQSSLSHECYLRGWAKQINVPILSIDYSLAPEAPFPRALEEVTYAYCWALKNYEILGTTGERIVAAGDSAGANLLLATTLKCLHLGIPLPVGLFIAYAPTLINAIPSPARLLCMMDPLLPFGFMMRCLKAYAIPNTSEKTTNGTANEATSDTESFEEISESDLMELQAHKSPVSETSDTLTYGSLNSGADDDRNIRDIDLQPSDIENSQKYVSDFLEKYVLDSDTETDGTRVPVLKHESATSSQSFDDSIPNRVSNFVTNLKWRFNSWLAQKTAAGVDFMVPRSGSAAEKSLDLEKQGNFLDDFQFTVPKDPYLSPFVASNEDLLKFPPVRALTVHLDPCLDDCVMFCKRLKELNKDVHLEILGGLPHGFLNFSLVSKEAFEGSKLCIKRINELLNLDNLPPLQ